MLTPGDGRRASAEGVLDARAGPSGQLYSAQQLGLLVPCQHGITNPTHLVYQPPTLTRVCRVDLARSPEQATSWLSTRVRRQGKNFEHSA